MNIQSQSPEVVPIEKECVLLVEEKQTVACQSYTNSYHNGVDEPRVLGFRPTTFWLSLLLSILLVAGAVGGGVGGGVLLKNSSKTSSKYASLDSNL